MWQNKVTTNVTKVMKEFLHWNVPSSYESLWPSWTVGNPKKSVSQMRQLHFPVSKVKLDSTCHRVRIFHWSYKHFFPLNAPRNSDTTMDWLLDFTASCRLQNFLRAPLCISCTALSSRRTRWRSRRRRSVRLSALLSFVALVIVVVVIIIHFFSFFADSVG